MIFRFFKRRPDFVIGPAADPYMLRWWLIPRNRFFNVYLHKFLRSDDDRALHDHPWPSIGMILKGSYIEHMPRDPRAWLEEDDRSTITRLRKPFRPVLRGSRFIHRIELMQELEPLIPRWGMSIVKLKPVWTLFITGPKIRDWGFWCPQGFRPWQEFVSVRPGGNATGKGCGE